MIRPTLIIAALILLCVACKDDPEPTVIYPETGFYGDNILFQSKTEYGKRENSFQAQLPAARSVAIRITGKNSSWGGTQPGGPITLPSGIWYIETGTVNNWAVGTVDRNNSTQTFTSIDGGQTCEIKMMFDEGSFVIEYFEHDLSTPNFTKTITVNY